MDLGADVGVWRGCDAGRGMDGIAYSYLVSFAFLASWHLQHHLTSHRINFPTIRSTDPFPAEALIIKERGVCTVYSICKLLYSKSWL